MSTQDPYIHENSFYQTSKPERLIKAIAHYELYKKIIDIPGHVIECGVFKGNSLIRLATYRQYLETAYSRKIYGFDMFGKFPETSFKDDKVFREKFIQIAGEDSLSKTQLNEILHLKGLNDNTELIEGDILKTIPEFIHQNPQLKISLLHIDVDIFEPTACILEYLWPKVVKGGIVIFDDYGIFPGATKAIDDYFSDLRIEKFQSIHTPTYIIKK